MSIIQMAKPEHEVAYQDLIQLMRKHAGKLTTLEMLAVAANLVGKIDGGVGWKLNYGNTEGVKHAAISLMQRYDYLISSEITMKEATSRLRMLRAARRALCAHAALGETE